jgi:hypothetical protein
MSTVGVMIGVGKSVGVAVGGNHTIVGVTVEVGGRTVSVGNKMVVGAAVQALQRIISKQWYKRVFIHTSSDIIGDLDRIPIHETKQSGD